jgi:hypothetical protein
MSRIPITTLVLAASMLSGCVTQPMGPTALVMPGSGKPFEAFAQEQATCKQFAGGQVDGGAAMANLQELGTAALSTALGAGLGAAAYRGRGAELGSSMGAVAGASLAARGSARDQNSLQGRYDLAYTQCMYAKGNQIAVAAPPTGSRVASGTQGGYPRPGASGPGARGVNQSGLYQPDAPMIR